MLLVYPSPTRNARAYNRESEESQNQSPSLAFSSLHILLTY